MLSPTDLPSQSLICLILGGVSLVWLHFHLLNAAIENTVTGSSAQFSDSRLGKRTSQFGFPEDSSRPWQSQHGYLPFLGLIILAKGGGI